MAIMEAKVSQGNKQAQGYGWECLKNRDGENNKSGEKGLRKKNMLFFVIVTKKGKKQTHVGIDTLIMSYFWSFQGFPKKCHDTDGDSMGQEGSPCLQRTFPESVKGSELGVRLIWLWVVVLTH